MEDFVYEECTICGGVSCDEGKVCDVCLSYIQFEPPSKLDVNLKSSFDVILPNNKRTVIREEFQYSDVLN